MRIGIISDTHGRPHPKLFHWLSGVDHIVHAGDFGDDTVLADLGSLAPITGVRGNVDRNGQTARLPELTTVSLGGLTIVVIHIFSTHPTEQSRFIERLEIEGIEQKADLLVYGHSHIPEIAVRSGVTVINPGSAGPIRFDQPVSAGVVDTETGDITIVDLASPDFTPIYESTLAPPL